MQRKYSLAHSFLAVVVALNLTLLIVCLDAQAQIAFTSRRDGNSEIYVMDADGGSQRRLTNNRHDSWAPSWSPGGKRIIFFSNREGHVHAKHGWATSEIYVIDADGGNPQNLTNDPADDGFPSWSPDGKRIAFASDRDENWEIYVMEVNGGNQRRLTNNRHDDDYPSWSPDGKHIVFSARRDGHFRNDLLGLTYEIYVMDADGGNQQRLTENRGNEWFPSWSPDGKRIVFTMSDNGTEIYVMDADGGNQQRLTNNQRNDRWPSWSPDSKRIVFASDRDRSPDFDIYVMDADGGNQQRLTNSRRNDAHPAWFGSTFAVTPAGKILTMWGWLKQVNRQLPLLREQR